MTPILSSLRKQALSASRNGAKVLLTVLFTWLFGLYCSGQQNLFNIPSGDVNPKKKVFYQHQLNVYSSKLESKAHLVYGLGKGWEAGVNLVGKGVYFTPQWRMLHNSDPAKSALYPILMFTGQKQWIATDRFMFNTGVQAGPNLSNKLSDKQLCYFTYALGTYLFGKGSRVVAGAYHGNQMFMGIGNDTGVMAGYEIKLNKRWYLMGDWISGRNDASVAVIGGMFNAGKRVQVCAGWMVPNPNTPKPQALVLEVNLLGWDVF